MNLVEKFRNFAARFMKATTKNNIRHLGEAIVYILLLVFFTYSVLFASALKGETEFWKDYQRNQSSLFAMVTNFGLLFLLLVDNSISEKRVFPNWLVHIGVFVLVTLFIYGHARVVTYPDIYQNYQWLLKCPYMYAWLHAVLILYLVFFKYQTLKEFVAKPV